ncbi:hypothetical protein J5751_03120 [bacterium]|nr:hypothetical protein [bacterium]
MKEKTVLCESTEAGGEKKIDSEQVEEKKVKCLLMMLLSCKHPPKEEDPEIDPDEWLDCKRSW